MANDEQQSPDKRTKPPKLPTAKSAKGAEDKMVGTLFAGRYEIQKRIGQGGMGIVYLARHKSLGRKVVIKTLNNTVTEEGKKRFEREARQLSSLSHSNIVTLYDFGYENESAYIVMEYVDGKTLKHLIRQPRRVGRSEFFNIAIQIADAVGEAHRRGVIHRDLKPANIMLTRQSGAQHLVKVLDFGLAKLNSADLELTKEGNLVGSVSYVPPEHILGEGSDTRGDIYSLGVVFYYMLAGEKPFEGADEMTVLYQHVHNEPTPLGELLDPAQEISQSTIDLIHSCLSKEPDERPSDASVLLERLLEEVSLSSLHMPLSSRDLTRLSNFSASEAEDAAWMDDSLDSGFVTGDDQHTPTHLPTSGTHSGHFHMLGDVTDSSSLSHSQILENSALLQVQMKRTRWLIGLVVVLLIGSGMTVWILSDNSKEDPVKESQLRIQRLESRLNDVEANLDEQKYGPAELILDGLKSELVDHPDLLDRASSYRDRITVGRLVREAQRYETREEWNQALEAYEKILNVQPTHNKAQAAIESISAKIDKPEAARFGSLKITSQPEAEVFIGDALVGSTPLTKKLPEGRHTVELRASGFGTWSESVMISKDSLLEISPKLESEKDAPVARRRPRPSPSRQRTVSKPAPQAKSDDKAAEKKASSSSSAAKKERPAAKPKPSSNDSMFESGSSGEKAESSDDLFKPSKSSKKKRSFDLLEVDEAEEESGSGGADFLD